MDTFDEQLVDQADQARTSQTREKIFEGRSRQVVFLDRDITDPHRL
jgi:hypothetical protein